MSFVDVILPDGTIFQEVVVEEEKTTQSGITTVEHETVHQTDELEVANVFDARLESRADEVISFSFFTR